MSARAFASEPHWATLARKVGSSESNRDSVARELRRIPHLENMLELALTGDLRPLALEVICDLNMRQFEPRLLKLTATDPDGFVTLAVNGMMDEHNRSEITKAYWDQLSDIKGRSDGALVAMLEPMGRLGIRLTADQLNALKSHPSPEVRDAVLYYARIMTLRHRDGGQRTLIEEFSRDKTQQVREHALAILSELRTSRWASAQ